MNKNDSIHILFKTLADTLPYEYNEEFIHRGNTIVLTKEDSDCIMYINTDETNEDDFTADISHDYHTTGHDEEHETLYWPSENYQIPLGTIITDIKNRF